MVILRSDFPENILFRVTDSFLNSYNDDMWTLKLVGSMILRGQMFQKLSEIKKIEGYTSH